MATHVDVLDVSTARVDEARGQDESNGKFEAHLDCVPGEQGDSNLELECQHDEKLKFCGDEKIESMLENDLPPTRHPSAEPFIASPSPSVSPLPKSNVTASASFSPDSDPNRAQTSSSCDKPSPQIEHVEQAARKLVEPRATPMKKPRPQKMLVRENKI